jgi:lipoate-protein ligase A
MFVEPRPDLVVPNPGGPADPLGESILDESQPWLRVFEPRDRRIVIGRGQDPAREVVVDAARADAVPIHRRVAGGGAVVLAPGMVVVAIRLANDRFGTDIWFERINAALIPAVAAACGAAVATRGHGDLAIAGGDGVPRKVLGASLRQTARWIYYLGALLVDDAVPLMERYLASPSRRPDYRGDRDHRGFCAALGAYGAGVAALIAAVEAECRRRLAHA